MNKRTFFAFGQFIDSVFPNCYSTEERQATIQQELAALQIKDRQFKNWIVEIRLCERLVEGLFRKYNGNTGAVKTELRELTDFITHYQLQTTVNEAYKKCRHQYSAQCATLHSGHPSDPA